MATGIIAVIIILFLLAESIVSFATGRSMSLWGIVLCGCFLLFLIWIVVVWIIIPYYKIEENVELFLDGYTSKNVTYKDSVQMTPTVEKMAKHLNKIMNSTELLDMNKKQAQYLALQNQINPHFLYNTLDSIRSEALVSGLNSVAEMTEALADFFRYTISNVENLVSVAEELQNCETYFKIQKYRFGERLQLLIECEPSEKDEIYNCKIPKLTIQPILENGIIHGTECKIGTGHLKIVLEKTGQRLLIRIIDDGAGMDINTLSDINERLQKSAKMFSKEETETKGGIALINVNNRIHLLFGEEYGLHMYSMQGIGTEAQITIPAISNEQEFQLRVSIKD